jgi:LDH2 family malate/lactate/ureidoglycolate dehydrogenase
MSVRLSLPQVHSLVTRTLTVAGLHEASRVAMADTITAAERDGCKSHGLFRLPHIVDGIRLGKVDTSSTPVLHDTAPSAVLVDGKCGMSPLAFKTGFPTLVEKTKTNGIAVMTMVDVMHYSALWHEVEALANEGLVGMAFLTSKSFMAHHGGQTKIYGTNPMAFGFPREDKPPLIWDQASAMMARGDISLHNQEGKPLPDGCGVGPDGKPTNDAAAVLAGAQLPFAQHKGTAIALMVELLAVGMTGAPFSFQQREEDVDENDASPTRTGELILAIDPTRVNTIGSSYSQHCEMLFDMILADQGTMLPSTGRHCGTERLQVRAVSEAEGIEIPQQLHDTIEQRVDLMFANRERGGCV